MNRNKNAFTLIELLVVISIIGFLAAGILVMLSQARQKSKVAAVIQQIHQVQTAVTLYYQDTGTYPVTCQLLCNASNDPFLNKNGVNGWNGPYMTLWNLKHPWGGHIDFWNTTHGPTITLDDDKPTGPDTDNSGTVPADALLEIDQKLDNGNLTSGKMQTGLIPECEAGGEICYVIPAN